MGLAENNPGSFPILKNDRGLHSRDGLLIINADDLGRDILATDACLECFRRNRITSSSIMVFMKDSQRAAELALNANLETGLHINLVTPFDGAGVRENTRRDQDLVMRFFRRGPWTQAIYHPFLGDSIARVFAAQREEYIRLFQREPTHYDGHKHFHLSLNMIFSNLLPPGTLVRRSFTLYGSGKGLFERSYRFLIGRCYRRAVDAWLLRRHVSTDAFFSISPVADLARLQGIIRLAQRRRVELMAHPWDSDHYAFLAGGQFAQLTSAVRLGNFAALRSLPTERS